MSKPKNSQFSGFAKAVLDKIYGFDKASFPAILSPEEAQIVLERAGKALVKHTIENVGPSMLDSLSTLECVERIPDLAELPEEKSK